MSPALLCTAVALLAAGGAGGPASPDGEGQGPRPRIEVEVPVFEGGEGLDSFFQCARDYDNANPNVHVNLYGDPRIADKVRIRILEGTLPEVSNAGINFWPLIRNGDMLPLDEFLDGPNWEGDSTWRDSFLPGVLERYEYEGHVYGIPLAYFGFVVWYNKAMFEEHGWKPTRTWDEFYALCDQVKAAGIPPLAFQGQYVSYIQALIDAGYYHLAGPERWFAQQQDLKPGSFDNPEFIEALRLTERITRNYLQDGATGMSHTQSQTEFFAGNTAMIFCGAWLKSEQRDTMPKDFRLGCFNLPIPSETVADPDALWVGSNYYFVFANSAHPNEGVDFLRFMTSRDQAGAFAGLRDIPTVVRGADQGHLTDDMADMESLAAKANHVYGQAPGEGFPEMTQYWTDCQFKVVNCKELSEAAAAALPEEVAKALEAGAAGVRDRAANPDSVTVRHELEPALLAAVLVILVGLAALGAVKQIREARAYGRSEVASAPRLSFVGVLLFLGPAAALYTLFVVIPCAKSFGWSLHRWDGLTAMTWVGMLNFRRLLFDSDTFWVALKHNLFIMFVIPAVVLPLSLFLAACVSRRLWGSVLFRVAFFFPNVLGVVADSLLWIQLYNPKMGPVNGMLVGLGNLIKSAGEALSNIGAAAIAGPITDWGDHIVTKFESYAWLAQNNLYPSLIPMSVWGAAGFFMVLFLAAMESIDVSLYEAAEIDGASAWRQFWTITLPLIRDVLAIALVFMVIGGMKAFETIWLLTNQRPTSDTHVVGTMMVNSMFTEFKVGEATAIAVLLFILVFFGSIATLRVMRRERVEF